MKIEIDLTDLVAENELRVLTAVLGCSNTVEAEQFKGILAAAFVEYAEMMLGKHLPTRANEFRERRLLHLLKYLFRDRLPTERDISTMFQLPESGSRSLLRNVRSKYRFELENSLGNTVRKALSDATMLECGNYRAVVRSENILEELKGVVSEVAPHLEQIKKVKDSASIYYIPVDTYDLLCEFYSIDGQVAVVTDVDE